MKNNTENMNNDYTHSYLLVSPLLGLNPNNHRSFRDGKPLSSEGIHLNTLDELQTKRDSFTTITRNVLGADNKRLVRKHKTNTKKLNPKHVQDKLVSIIAEFQRKNMIKFNGSLIIQ